MSPRSSLGRCMPQGWDVFTRTVFIFHCLPGWSFICSSSYTTKHTEPSVRWLHTPCWIAGYGNTAKHSPGLTLLTSVHSEELIQSLNSFTLVFKNILKKIISNMSCILCLHAFLGSCGYPLALNELYILPFCIFGMLECPNWKLKAFESRSDGCQAANKKGRWQRMEPFPSLLTVDLAGPGGRWRWGRQEQRGAPFPSPLDSILPVPPAPGHTARALRPGSSCLQTVVYFL